MRLPHTISIWLRQSDARHRVGMTLTWVVASLGLSAVHAAPEIRFAPEKDYGPFVFESADGQIQGLSVDILNALRPMLEVSITTQPARPLAAILAAAQRGEVDLISSLRPTPERSAYLAFTSPYVQVPAVLVVRQSVTPAHLRDLAKQRVAVGQGYAVEPYVRKAYPQVDWQAVPDDLSALQGLLRGNYQGVVADIASVSHATQTQQIRGVQVVEAIGFEYPLSFAYRKELPQLGQQLQMALQRLDPQTRQEIVDRWINSEALRFEDPRRSDLRWSGLALAVAATLVLSWAHWRRRRGRSR